MKIDNRKDKIGSLAQKIKKLEGEREKIAKKIFAEFCTTLGINNIMYADFGFSVS